MPRPSFSDYHPDAREAARTESERVSKRALAVEYVRRSWPWRYSVRRLSRVLDSEASGEPEDSKEVIRQLVRAGVLVLEERPETARAGGARLRLRLRDVEGHGVAWSDTLAARKGRRVETYRDPRAREDSAGDEAGRRPVVEPATGRIGKVVRFR